MSKTEAERLLLYTTTEVAAAGDRLSAALAAEAGFSRLGVHDFQGDLFDLWARSRQVVDRAMADYSAAMDRLIEATTDLDSVRPASVRLNGLNAKRSC